MTTCHHNRMVRMTLAYYSYCSYCSAQGELYIDSAGTLNSWSTADFDLHGDMDVTDFDDLANGFLPGGYGNAPSQVPKSSTTVLWVLGRL